MVRLLQQLSGKYCELIYTHYDCNISQLNSLIYFMFFPGKIQRYQKLSTNICKILLHRKKYCLILFESIILQLFETIQKSSRTPVVTEITKFKQKQNTENL